MAVGEPLVKTKGLSKYFISRRSLIAKLIARQKDRLIKAVDCVDLVIHPGETLGLVGEWSVNYPWSNTDSASTNQRPGKFSIAISRLTRCRARS